MPGKLLRGGHTRGNPRPIADRLLEKRIIDDNGCWIFTGSKSLNGYGMIYDNGRPNCAHIVSYRIFVGEPKPGNYVLHKPICKSRACFNPEHLYEGTQLDNMWDAIDAGTHNSMKGRRNLYRLKETGG